MKISKLVELLNGIQESHGDIDVRAGSATETKPPVVTGLWVQEVPKPTYVKLAIPPKRSGW